MDVMREQHLTKEEVSLFACSCGPRVAVPALCSHSMPVSPLQKEIRQQLAEKAKSGDLKVVNGSTASQAASAVKRKRRWDQTADQTPSNATPKKVSSWDQADAASEVSREQLAECSLIS